LFTTISIKLDALRRDQRGTVAMIFALCIFALIMAMGLAIDIARAIHTKTKISSALDAAALAAAKSLHDGQMSTGDIMALARRYFDINLGESGRPNFGNISDFNVVVDKDKSTVSISATADVPTTFARIGGVEKISLPTSAAAAFSPKDIELALSLDVTGSMCSPCSKIADLQSAARDMIDILLPFGRTSTNKVRVGLAPFAAGVNAGAYAIAATNKTGSDNCVFERDGADAATDAAAAGSYLKIAGDPGVAATRNNCPSSGQVTALSDNTSSLKDAISDLRSGGSTAGHLGTAWAWYLVSPKWASIWPSASRPAEYGDGKTIKAVVLMTDGVYNTFGGACDRGCTNASTQARKSQDLADQLCKNMKDQKVVVYSVGFMLDDPIAETVLKSCASSTNTFFRAENGDQLRTAFRRIAEDLLRLRLSQ
jgi:Flp pilus assembly protein TadG